LSLWNTPPTASISLPPNNATISLGEDAFFDISLPDFFNGSANIYYEGLKIGTTDEEPFEFVWSPETWGGFQFSTIALTSFGVPSARSARVNLNVPYDGNSDGRPDWWDHRYLRGGGYYPNNDDDGDGMTNAQELAMRTDPHNRDTDGDGFWDGADFDPLDPTVTLGPPTPGDTTAPVITLIKP